MFGTSLNLAFVSIVDVKIRNLLELHSDPLTTINCNHRNQLVVIEPFHTDVNDRKLL